MPNTALSAEFPASGRVPDLYVGPRGSVAAVEPRSSRVVLRAHAKLTMSLRITGVRPDGYHLIDAEMVSLDLHDLITIEPRPTTRSTRSTRSTASTGPTESVLATGPFAHGVPTGADNLVVSALRFARAEARIEIDKRIPHGGGLGGGSTDGASVLRWAGIGTSPGELAEVAAIGADIPFCLVGGRARVQGIGEIVEPLPHVPRTVTLVIPPLRVSTPAVYRAWDELETTVADGPPTGNHLEPAALVVEPRLTRWRTLIADRTGTAPTLAGSGATWFTVGEHHDALADLVDEGATVMMARTVPSEIATNRVG